MQTQTETQAQIQEAQVAEKDKGLVKIVLGSAFDLKDIKPENAIIIADDGAIELVSKIIPYQSSADVLVCTLSKRNDGVILEKSYNYREDRKSHHSQTIETKEGSYSYEWKSEFLKEKLGE